MSVSKNLAIHQLARGAQDGGGAVAVGRGEPLPHRNANPTSTPLSEAYDDTASGGQVFAVGAIALNQWQMFTATLNGLGNVTLYKNGSPIATGTTAVPSLMERINCYIGRSNWADDAYYEGRI